MCVCNKIITGAGPQSRPAELPAGSWREFLSTLSVQYSKFPTSDLDVDEAKFILYNNIALLYYSSATGKLPATHHHELIPKKMNNFFLSTYFY